MSHSARSHSSGAICPDCNWPPPRWRQRDSRICHDRDVHGAAVLRCRAQLGQDQGLELRFCLRQLLGFCLQRLVGHGPLLKNRVATAFERGRICAGRTPMPRTRSPTPHPRRERGAGTCSQQTQNLGSGARRGAGSRRLGIGIKPSRWASLLAALRARRMASAFSRVLRSDGFSYALRRFNSRKTPSRCIFFLRTLIA